MLACLSFAPLCTSLLRRSHLFGVDYFPHRAVRLIMRAPPRFVSCHLINENKWKELPLYLCLLMTLFSPPHSPLSDRDNDPLLPSLPYIYIYIYLIEAISSFRRLCHLFIDALRHRDHAVLMLWSIAVINPLCIKPHF